MNRLYYSPLSPFARKVRIAIIEKGLADQFDLVEVATSPLDTNAELADRNPLGKIPCLQRADGRVIYDSRAILRYVDGLGDAAPLYESGDSAFDRLTLESLAEGVIEAALLCVYEKRFRDAAHVSQAWLDGQADKIARALDWFEAHVADALDARFDAAVIGLVCALGYIDFRQPVGDWRAGRPRLAAWYKTVSARPSLVQTEPA
ncbi:glutathione S-transferase [Ruegeria sediminis]|uniref:Glutathione S-transferase n=1 Tax=Ruegeria sediminis TaxID=2583820 RepID=A0ABY2WV27_9RHOB|nr:glutathione S-transferase [Ruegeria sediminis]TMV05576.1 glutathione S-transferase [Ruegeria sediminis]